MLGVQVNTVPAIIKHAKSLYSTGLSDTRIPEIKQAYIWQLTVRLKNC